MTTFEERLAATNLTPFKQTQVKDDLLKLLIKQLYKYQSFKNDVMISKINRMHYNEKTIVNYMSHLRKYLATGYKSEAIMSRFYDIIDDLKAKHEAILTPSETDKYKQRRPYKGQVKTKEASTPSPTPPKPVETPKYIEIAPDQYGVKIQNPIKLYANKEACDAYIECYKEFNGDKPVEVVKVDFQAV